MAPTLKCPDFPISHVGVKIEGTVVGNVAEPNQYILVLMLLFWVLVRCSLFVVDV